MENAVCYQSLYLAQLIGNLILLLYATTGSRTITHTASLGSRKSCIFFIIFYFGQFLLELWLLWQHIRSGWPQTLENRENEEKKIPAGKNQGI